MTSCATIPLLAGDAKLTQSAAPGPYRVVEYDADWFDAARNRHVPVHFYAPEAAVSMPVVIFSHGLGNSRNGYAYLGRYWASYGYLSVHPEHLDANEEVTKHGLLHLYRAGFDRRNYRKLPEDIHFIIDQLQSGTLLPGALRGRIDAADIAVSGHSIGAYAALAVGGLRVLFPNGDVVDFRDPRVKAAMPISMSENFNASSYRDIAIPMLHITGTRDSSILYGTLPRKRRVPFNSIRRLDQYLLVLRAANHSTYSDDESAANRDAHDAIRIATITFLDAYLRGDARALETLRSGDLASVLEPAGKFSTKEPAVRIGKVTVKTEPLFSGEEASRGGFYRTANLLAVQTHEPLIRRFLLFREGEPFDQAKLRESERNLRALDFLKSAAVTAGPAHDGVVDVTVATQDALTTDVNADFSNDGGRSLYDFDVTQKNIAGTGGEVDVRITNARERRTNSIELIHPTLLGPYCGADAFLARSSDGNELRLGVSRPLFSYSTRQTFDASFDHLLRDERVYHDGAVSDLFRHQHRSFTVMEGVVLAANPGSTTRLLAGIDVQRDGFRPLSGIQPVDRDFRFIEAGIDTTSLRFVTLSHVDLGLREQDFPIGFHGALIGGVSPGVSRIRTELAYGRTFSPRTLLLAKAAATRRGSSEIVSVDTRWIAQRLSEHPRTFIARVRTDLGRDLDRDVQFFADGQNGLRAYPNFAFAGARRFAFNVEQRWFLGREWLQLFEPGAAVFFDTGTATDASLFRTRLRSDVGAGLRFGVARFESTMLRFDVAYALNDSPLSRRGIVFSFATGQAF